MVPAPMAVPVWDFPYYAILARKGSTIKAAASRDGFSHFTMVNCPLILLQLTAISYQIVDFLKILRRLSAIS